MKSVPQRQMQSTKMNPNLVWALILLALACRSASANICDTCKCAPNADPKNAKSIECNCDTKTRTINTTIENLKDLLHIESFTVMNCDTVNFHRESFGNSHDLSNVILRSVKTAVFPVGVFSKLDMLKIEYVDDLRLMENAFMGAEMGEIAIRHSSMKEIPARALFNVKLRKLELTEVNIGLIKSNSTYIVMGEQSNLIIDGCQLGEVETQGMKLTAHTLRMSGTTLTNLAPSSIIIDAAIGIDISSSTFGVADHDADGMRIASKTINIFNNTFKSIPIALELIGKGGKITITENFFHDIPLRANILGFIGAEFVRNYCLCDCELAENLASAESIAVGDPKFTEVLTSNFCKSNCSEKLSLKDFLDKAKVTCTSDTDVDLCSAANAVVNGNDTDINLSDSRDGRKVGDQDHTRIIDEPLVTPEAVLPLKSNYPKYGTSNSLIIIFLMTLFLMS